MTNSGVKAFGQVRILETDTLTIDYKSLDINFNVTFQEGETLPTCKINVYNLTRKSIENLSKSKLFRLKAGYEAYNGYIFTGILKSIQTESTSDGGNNVSISLTPQKVAWNGAFISKTWNAFTVVDSVVKDIINMAGWNAIKLGTVGAKEYKHGKTFRGTARHCLEEIAKDYGMTYMFENGDVYFYGKDSHVGNVVVLDTNDVSLIESPKQKEVKNTSKSSDSDTTSSTSASSDDGKQKYSIKAVLRHDFKVGGLVKINNSKYMSNRPFKIISGSHSGTDSGILTNLVVEEL